MLNPPHAFATRICRRLLPIADAVRRRPAEVHALRCFRKYCRQLSAAVEDPYFVKIGANDGVTGDACSDILLCHTNFRGLLVEPVPYCVDRLRKNFSDPERFRIADVAIGADSGEATFYYVDSAAGREIPDLPSWFDQLGSFDRRHIVKHLDGLLEPYIVETVVRVCTLSEVLQHHCVPRIDLLHVDTEGHDYEVIKSLDFERFSPPLLYVEHQHLSRADRTAMRSLLADRGYEVIDCTRDYFAIHKGADERIHPSPIARARLAKLAEIAERG